MKFLIHFIFILLPSISFSQTEITRRDSGKCYALCYAPYIYRFDTVKAVVTPQHKKIILTPESYLVSTDTVQYATGDTLMLNIPGEYDITEEKMMVAPSKKIWVVVGRDTSCHSQFPEDCNIKEPQTVDAKYKTLTTYNVLQQGGKRRGTGERKFKQVTIYESADPPSKKKITVQATYTTVITKTLISNPNQQIETEVICPEKISQSIIHQIQSRLHDLGYDVDESSSEITSVTNSSLEKFQKQNDLPVGGLNIETLRLLGIDY